ncbi:MAG TPA: choice-of-anchor tandem repeat GloVer-containing protein, partial [Candidatus Saccharimonadales bacterium]|nr:choice-of-anchor tandem repeat GloVer-containing protein [Candidatus Saccharimonadales bacterium]
VTTNGVLTTLYPFNFGEGAIPTAGLTLSSDGNFYGTTDSGGANGLGTVFRISPGGAYETLVSFDGFNDGSHPASALVEGPDGSLYGTTTSGGPGNQGTIFQLRVTSAPRITSQPANTIALVGETISLSVAVAGASPFSYQWKKDGGNIAGATNRVLTIINAAFSNNGTYSAVVSNALNFVTSGNAQLTVVLPPAFQSVSATNGNVRLSWSAFAGQRYRLQFNSSLGTTNWTNAGSTITATGNSVVTTNVAGAIPQRFYRIQLLR